MKCKFISSLLALLGAGSLSAQVYTNYGLVVAPPDIPPMIDARDFINGGHFLINMTNTDINTVGLLPPILLPEYYTTRTVNYTNEAGALMAANTGFRFTTFDPDSPAQNKESRASSFFNEGAIHSGTLDTSNYLVWQADAYLQTTQFLFTTIAGSRLTIDATNVINRGEIDMGFDSLLKISGNSDIGALSRVFS